MNHKGITFKISDRAGNETFYTTVVNVNPISYLQVIPEFIPPVSDVETSNEITSDEGQIEEQTFGGSQNQGNESTTQTLVLTSSATAGANADATTTTNILWGVIAASAIGMVTAQVLEQQRQREEEEARQLSEVQASVDAQNAAIEANRIAMMEELRIRNWLEGQATLDAWIEHLESQGASADEIDDLREQAGTNGLGTAVSSAENLSISLATQQLINQQAYDIYRQGEYVSVPIEDEPEEESLLDRVWDWVTSPSTWWNTITQNPVIDWMRQVRIPIHLPILSGLGPNYLNPNDPQFLLERTGVTALEEIVGPLSTSVGLRQVAETLAGNVPVGRYLNEVGIRTLGRTIGNSVIPVTHFIGLPLTLAPSLVRNWQNGSRPSRWIADILIDGGGYIASELAGLFAGAFVAPQTGGLASLPYYVGADLAAGVTWEALVASESNREGLANQIDNIGNTIWNGVVDYIALPNAMPPVQPPIPNPMPNTPVVTNTPIPLNTPQPNPTITQAPPAQTATPQPSNTPQP
jgi:hypothetical protein